jgi:hypothetical protein
MDIDAKKPPADSPLAQALEAAQQAELLALEMRLANKRGIAEAHAYPKGQPRVVHGHVKLW